MAHDNNVTLPGIHPDAQLGRLAVLTDQLEQALGIEPPFPHSKILSAIAANKQHIIDHGPSV